MKNVFREVFIKKAAESSYSLKTNDHNYIMIPTLISVEHAGLLRPSPFTKPEFSVILEWNLINKSGDTVWIEAITGTYIGSWKERSIE